MANGKKPRDVVEKVLSERGPVWERQLEDVFSVRLQAVTKGQFAPQTRLLQAYGGEIYAGGHFTPDEVKAFTQLHCIPLENSIIVEELFLT